MPVPSVPTVCDVCNSERIIFTTNDRVYGRIYGDWPYLYFCEGCGASVGCHQNTRNALGRLANKKTRNLRKETHAAFDVIWQQKLKTRHEAYIWLAEKLGIDPGECHISWLTDEQLVKAKQLSIEFLSTEAVNIRRQEKKSAKINRRSERERQHIERRKRSKP